MALTEHIPNEEVVFVFMDEQLEQRLNGVKVTLIHCDNFLSFA